MPIFLTDHLTIILGDTMADRVEGEEEELLPNSELHISSPQLLYCTCFVKYTQSLVYLRSRCSITLTWCIARFESRPGRFFKIENIPF